MIRDIASLDRTDMDLLREVLTPVLPQGHMTLTEYRNQPPDPSGTMPPIDDLLQTTPHPTSIRRPITIGDGCCRTAATKAHEATRAVVSRSMPPAAPVGYHRGYGDDGTE